MTGEVVVRVFSDGTELAEYAASTFVELVTSAQREPGDLHVAVTGGSTGIAVLAAIRESPRAASIDWSRIHVWWGDERFLAAGDSERNDVQAARALLDHVDIDPAKIHHVATTDGPIGDDPDAAAAAYAADLAQFGDPGPAFDLVMLGLGEEGHTASVFPDSPAVRDPRTACAVRDCPKPPPTRVTMTLPTLSNARQVWFMTTGTAKAQAVAASLAGEDIDAAPASGVIARGLTSWLIDEAAAAELPELYR